MKENFILAPKTKKDILIIIVKPADAAIKAITDKTEEDSA